MRDSTSESCGSTTSTGLWGRSSDNQLLREITDWQPTTTLREGLNSTYGWIWGRLARHERAKPPVPRGPLLPVNLEAIPSSIERAAIGPTRDGSRLVEPDLARTQQSTGVGNSSYDEAP